MTENRNQRSTPPSHGLNDDLYAQIAAGDEIQTQTKRRSSFIVSFMVEYMRLTLALDALRRDYRKLFHVLGICWAVVMSILYLCGIIMFGILVASYMRFPDYVREQLEKNDILYDKMEIPGYIVSRIKIQNLHNKENSYKIDELDISSTFADFLNRRIKNLSIKGFDLVLDGKNPAEDFSKIFSKTPLSRGAQNIRVDTLKVSDSKIILKTNTFEVPISFSLTGLYGNNVNISSYINITQPFLTIKGPLTIKSSGKQLTWDLGIQTGLVALPKRPQEILSGNVSLKTNSTDIVKLSADLNLLYEKIKKNLKLSLDKRGKQFEGKLDFNWADITDTSNKKGKTELSLSLSKLDLTSSGKLETNAPIKLDFSTTLSNIKFTNLKGDLKGNLSCQLTESCKFDLKEKAFLSTKTIQFPLPEGFWNSTGISSIVLDPKTDLFNFAIPQGEIKLKADISNLSLKGKQDDTKSSISAKTLRLNGLFNIWDKYISSSLSASNLNYSSPNYELQQATFEIDDIFNKAKKVYLNSSQIQLKNTDFNKIPFQLSYIKENNLTSISLNTKKDNISLLFLGYLEPMTGDINGRFVVPKFSLNNLIENYKDTKLISQNLKSISGEVAAYGQLVGNMKTTINGPFYVAISNAGLKTNEIELKGINTSLSMQSLMPFVTLPKQSVFIEQIQSIFPIDDVEMTLKLENRFAQIASLTANIAGIPFFAEASLVPYKDVSTLIYLRNANPNISQLRKAVSIPNWKIIGDLYGSVFFPIEVKNLALSIKNATIQLSDTQVKYTGRKAKKPAILGDEDQFMIKSGNILIDAKKETLDEVTITFLLDILLGKNSNIKKVLRETIDGDLSDIVGFKDKKPAAVPRYIKQQIIQIFKNIDSFNIK